MTMNTTTMTRNRFAIRLDWLIRQYLLSLAAEGLIDPLSERLTLATVFVDLYDLAGAPAPNYIRNRIEE